MNKQLICDYINYNAPKLHNLGDALRAMVDKKYRLHHLGLDITPSQIVNIEHISEYLNIAVNKGIKGIPTYRIPRFIEPPLKSLLTINDKISYQEYIRNLTSDTFFWNNFAIFHSDLYWMIAIIPDPFELPRWYIMDKYIEFISVKFSNSMPCPEIRTEDANYKIVSTPIDNNYIQNLIS